MHNYPNINLFLFTNINLFKLYSGYNFFLYTHEKAGNFFLQNVFSLYHPIFLYIYLICLFKLFFFKFHFYYLLKLNFFFNKYFFLFISFVFSSLWSSQELFWNGFWNWDIVEVSLLNIVLLCVLFYHTKKNNKTLFFFKLFILCSFFFFFLTNKTNFFLSQHSFSSSFFFLLVYLYWIFFFFFFFKIFFLNSVYLKKNIKIFFFINLILILIMFFFKIFLIKWEYNFFVIFFWNLFFLCLSFRKLNFILIFNFNFFYTPFVFFFKYKFFLFHIIVFFIQIKCAFFRLNFQKDFFTEYVFNYWFIKVQNTIEIINSLKFNAGDELIINFSIYTNFSYVFFFFKLFGINTNYCINLYLNKIKIQKKIKLFKKRKFTSISFNLNQNNFLKKKNFFLFRYVYSRFSMFLELKFYRFFFLRLRRLSKKRKFKSFVFLCCNHIFSKKSKNSRMGKGKGKFVRFVFRTKTLKPIFIFKKISKYRVASFVRYLNNKSENVFFSFI